MPEISIIVPVYNVEKYLHCCMDSILAQTYENIEVLLIDDGSTDGSSAICDEYALKDKRVRVYHKSNGGVSSARNLGLNEATGNWIMFVDSDDKVSPKVCERMLEYAAEGCWPISPCYVFEDQQIRKLFATIEGDICFDARDFYKLGGRIYSCWGKLYCRETLNNAKLHFIEEFHYAEDAIFTHEYLAFIKYIYVIDEPLYFYRILPNSLSHGRYIRNYEQCTHRLYECISARAKQFSANTDLVDKLYYPKYFLDLCKVLQNNMHKDAPGSWFKKLQKNNAVLKSPEFKKVYPYRYDRAKDFTKRYFYMLELSYYTGSYFWLWLLGVPGKIKKVICRKK